MILSYTLPSIALFLYFALNNRMQKEENNHILVRLRFGELLSFAAPIGILGAVIGATKFVDKMFVGYYLGLSDLAIYAVAMKFSLIIYNLDIAFAAVWGPTFLKKYLANQDADLVKQIFTIYLAAMILIIIGIITISGAILELFFPPSYSQSLDLLPYLLFAAGLQSCSANLSNIYDICKKTKFHLYFGLGNLILFLLLLTFLVPAIGLIGVGIAAVISALVDAALRIIFARNLLLGWVNFPSVIGYFFVLAFGTIILPLLTNDVMLINSGIVLLLVWHQTKKYFFMRDLP
jgi:O-antigen/teichoic acid export membrane protein